MRAAISSQTFICSPTLLSASFFACSQAVLTGFKACKAVFKATTSRGVTRPTATFEMIRSRSPTLWNESSISSRNSGSRKKYSTISSLSLIGFCSFKGKTTHRFSNRAPIGETVLSITSQRDLPSSCIGYNNSSERTVNLSSRTYFSSSIRASEVM